MNILNRKTQIAAFVAAASAFLVLLKFTTPEVANSFGVLFMAGLALVSRDDAPKGE